MSETIVNTEPTAEANQAETTTSTEETTASVESTSPAATNENWFSADYNDLVESKGFKSADDALKSYKNLEAMVGNSVRIPSEDASDQAKQEFLDKIKHVDGVLLKSDEKLLNKLGKPETVDGYDLNSVVKAELIETVPNLNAELDDFKAIAHEVGLSNDQAAKLVDMRLKTVEAQQNMLAESRANAEAELKRLWGAEYNNRLDAAKQVVKIYSDKYGDSVMDLVNSPAGNNPALLNMLSELAGMYKEQKHEGMSSTQLGMTPEMALSKIAEKRADQGFLEAYNNDRHPGHKKAVSEMAHLYAIVNGQ